MNDDTNQRARECLERWPGYEQQSWAERFAELDKRYRERGDKFFAAAAAWKSPTSAREEALREAAPIIEELLGMADCGCLDGAEARDRARKFLSLITGGGGYDAD